MMNEFDEKRIEEQVLSVLHPLIGNGPITEQTIRAVTQQTIALLQEEAFICTGNCSE